jgi:hypothetical protein
LQAPLRHVSVCVQALPSSHLVPSAFATAVHAPVVWLHVPVLQASVSALQSTGVPALHVSVAGLHVSVPLQALPSLQSVSFVQPHLLLSTVHPPSPSEQLSMVQAMPSLHTTCVPPQTPFVQASPVVHTKPSLHDDPSDFLGLEQTPLAGSQVPAVWHWSDAVHTTGVAPLQAPDWQVSDWVQAFVSSHVVPSAFAGFVHLPLVVSQVPTVWH